MEFQISNSTARDLSDFRRKIAEILKKRHYNPEQPDAKEMQKQYGYLMRRGYKSEDILRVMKCPDYLT